MICCKLYSFASLIFAFPPCIQVCKLFVDLPRTDVTRLLDRISPVYQQCRGRPSSFAEYHVSANSFWENKHMSQGKRCHVPSFTFPLYLQRCTFKTYRSDTRLHNPTVTDRLKSKLYAAEPNRLSLGSVHDGSAKDIKGSCSAKISI